MTSIFQFKVKLLFPSDTSKTLPLRRLHLMPVQPLWPLISYTLPLKPRPKPLWTPLFVSRLTTDIWTPLLLPNFQPLFKRDKRDQASDRPKVTLHHVVLSRPDTETMRWRYSTEEPVWSELSWRRGSGVKRSSSPPGELCRLHSSQPVGEPEAPAGPDCRRSG